MSNQISYYVLFCSERSGSNFIMDFIERRTGSFALPVSHIVRLMMSNRLKFGDFNDDRSWNSFLRYCQYVLDTGIGSSEKRINLYDTNIKTNKDRNIFTILESIVRQSGFTGDTVIIKENLLFEFLPALLPFGRISGIIYQVRNPLGVVSSMLRSPNHFGDVMNAAQKWNREQLAFLRALGYVVDALPHLFLRYEDVISEPDVISSSILRFLHPRPSTVTIKTSSDESSNKVHKNNQGSHIDNLKLVDGQIRKDRNDIAISHLTEKENGLVNEICSDLMQLFGYVESNTHPKVNVYPEWLVEKTTQEISVAIGSSRLSDEEKTLRIKRNRVIAELINRPIHTNLLFNKKSTNDKN